MLQLIFKIINHLYPSSFRQEFNQEILADLADMDIDLIKTDRFHRLIIIKRETLGWISSILREQFYEINGHLHQMYEKLVNFSKIRTEEPMTIEKSKKENRIIINRSETLIACLPPFIFGSAVWLTWLIIGGPWYTATQTQLKAGLAGGLCLAGVIAVGGIFAIVKRFPLWGYTWLGTDIVGFILLVKGLTEEQPNLLPEWVNLTLIVILFVFSAWVLISAVLKSWQAAGLVSIGMASAMGLANVHLMAIGPYHRVDLAVLGLIAGVTLSGMTYAYLRTSIYAQAILLAGTGLLNIGLIYTANQVWAQQMTAAGKTTPLLPMVVILLILLLAGPVAGLFQKPVKMIFGKLIK